MALPLFDEPKRAWIRSPQTFAYDVGFSQGAGGQGKSHRYDADDEIDRFYQDGHRIGRLFRPLPIMREK